MSAPRVIRLPSARRPRSALVDRPTRRTLRLWLPLTPIAALLSPLALVAVALLQPVLRRRGYAPWRAALSLGALLMALSGTLIEVERRDIRIRIAIF
jgi:hypothetical protein